MKLTTMNTLQTKICYRQKLTEESCITEHNVLCKRTDLKKKVLFARNNQQQQKTEIIKS